MFKIVSSEIGITFESNLSLKEATILVENWEDSDKVEGIYTPEFYQIKEEFEEGDE
jgi:hypothetical protein